MPPWYEPEERALDVQAFDEARRVPEPQDPWHDVRAGTDGADADDPLLSVVPPLPGADDNGYEPMAEAGRRLRDAVASDDVPLPVVHLPATMIAPASES